MAAPNYAEPIGDPDDGEELPDFECECCGYEGNGRELLGVDPDENTTLWCPQCRTSGWIWA